MKPHKHAELIKAWADGAEIEYWQDGSGWYLDMKPKWNEFQKYRIKPEPKPDRVQKVLITSDGCFYEGQFSYHFIKSSPNLNLIWDGETGKLKSAEVLK